jgi:hypothetical protein
MANTIRAERLERAEIIAVDRGTYGRVFGPMAIPALVVVRAGTVRWIWHPPVTASPGPLVSVEVGSQLRGVIHDLLGPSSPQ